MNFSRYTPQALQEYREKMVETAKLRNKLGEISEISGVTADFGPAHDLLQEFGRESKALADLARNLGAEGVFLAKYGYEKIDGTTAQFVIPRNCPRLEILQEAQGLAVVQQRAKEGKRISQEGGSSPLSVLFLSL